MDIPECLRPYFCLRLLSACSFCQHVGLQQANCADLPRSLRVITDFQPPIVDGVNHSVGFRRNFADNCGAVSKGAALTDRCLDGLCVILSVAQVFPCTRRLLLPRRSVRGSLLWYIVVVSQEGSCSSIAGHLSFGAVASRRAMSLLDSVYKLAAKHWMSRGIPCDSEMSTLSIRWSIVSLQRGLDQLLVSRSLLLGCFKKGWSFASRTAHVSLVACHGRVLERSRFRSTAGSERAGRARLPTSGVADTAT